MLTIFYLCFCNNPSEGFETKQLRDTVAFNQEKVYSFNKYGDTTYLITQDEKLMSGVTLFTRSIKLKAK